MKPIKEIDRFCQMLAGRLNALQLNAEAAKDEDGEPVKQMYLASKTQTLQIVSAIIEDCRKHF